MTTTADSVPPSVHEPGAYDGVICFGGVDWWYHNRGHYDLQMMREFSEHLPVIYINSIGMRPPQIGEGKMFFRRILRKFKSLRRGMVQVRKNFTVYSPATLPGGGNNAIGRWIARKLLSFQVRRVARRSRINRPLVWIACPPACSIIDDLRPTKVVYQRTDRFEDFEGVNRQLILEYDEYLKARSDLVLYCARELYDAENDQCKMAEFVDHGVDYERFESAGLAVDRHNVEPDDLASIPRPRVGFIGGIDAHTFDPPLFLEVVKLLPDVQFVMVGACSLPENWCPYENVHFFGQRPYEEVAAYMAASDVLIMPWNQSDWIKACNPVKTKEYLAVGRPVVTTYFPEIDHYSEHVEIAADAHSFAEAIRAKLENPGMADARRARVKTHTWQAKSEKVTKSLNKLN